MSWDIYGEPLRRGHCEVHPYVHEEYPCSVCIADKRSSDHGDCRGVEHDLYLAREHIDYLKQEIVALTRDLEVERYHRQAVERSEQAMVAHVERLCGALEELVEQTGHPNISGWVDIERAIAALAKARGEL